MQQCKCVLIILYCYLTFICKNLSMAKEVDEMTLSCPGELANDKTLIS